MESKKSLCNNTIFKQDLRRFMPAMITHTALLQLIVTLPEFTTQYAYQNEPLSADYKLHHMIESLNMLSFPLFAIVIGLVYAILLFSYLHKEKEAYNLHALPIRRKTLFFSHYLAGIIYMAIPVAITIILLYLINIAFGVGFPATMFITFAETMIENIFFFSLSALVMMLSGNTIAAFVVYGVLNACIPAFNYLLSGVCELFTYGLNSRIFRLCDLTNRYTPFKYFYTYLQKNNCYDYETGTIDLSSLYRLNDFGHVLIYLVVALAFAAIAVYLYKKRHIEEVGELMVFKFAKSTFRIVFTVFLTMILTLIIDLTAIEPIAKSITYNNHFYVVLVLCILCGLVSYIIANMILQRSVHVLKSTSYGGFAILAICMVLCLAFNRSFPYSYKNKGITEATVTVYEYTTNSAYSRSNVKDGRYQFDLDKLDRLADFTAKVQKEGQNRAINYFVTEEGRKNRAGDFQIYYQSGEDNTAFRYYNLYFELTNEQMEELKQLLSECATLQKDDDIEYDDIEYDDIEYDD